MLAADLEQLEYAELIRRAQMQFDPLTGSRQGIEYWFRHVLVQETTYEALLRQDRRRLHRLVAQSLEGAADGATDALAVLLARHWDDAGEPERALGYYVRAGKSAARVYANAEALLAYDRACALARELDVAETQLLELYVERGRVMELRGNYREALENYQELEELGKERGEARLQLEALIQRAKIHATPNQFYDAGQADALAQRALALARVQRDRPAEAKVLWNLLLLNHFSGHLDEAIRYGEESLAIARELDLREQMAYTLNDLSRPYVFLKRHAEAHATLAEAERLFRELGNMPMLTDNLTSVSSYAMFTGEFQASLAPAQEALQLSEEIGNVWGQAFANEMLGMMYYELGELESALQHAQRSVTLGAQVNFLDALYTGQLFIGLIYRELGESEKGLALVEAWLTPERAKHGWAVGLLAVVSLMYSEQGDIQRAARELQHAQDLFNGNMDSPAPFIMALAEVNLRLAQGRAVEAVAAAERMVEKLEEVGIRSFKAKALVVKAIAHERAGDLEAAVNTLERAREEATETGSRSSLWEILALLTRLYGAMGREEAAQEARREGRVVAQFVADHAPQELRASFLKREEVGRLMKDDAMITSNQ